MLSLKVGRLKGIPYEPEDRGDGNPNVGFYPLKGRPQESDRIPEARNEPALQYALKKLNATDTAFFTAGCEKRYNDKGVRARPIGYLEFAYNSIALARVEDSYQQLSGDLDSAMIEAAYGLPVEFEFIISPTRFNTHGFDGFSSAVYVKTSDYLPYRVARARWRQAVHFLTDFLCTRPGGPSPLFFAP